MSGLSTERAPFLAKVGEYKPRRAVRIGEVLNALVEWSEGRGGEIEFTPHTGSAGREPQALVKYCVPGVGTPFWAAYPRAADGAKLHVLTDPHPRFPEDLRREAREVLAGLDGRRPNPTECPVVSFETLADPAALASLLALLASVLDRLGPTSD